jgi:hypothetical protein
MLPHAASAPSSTPDDREARVRALVEQMRPAAEAALRRAAEALADAPDHELLGAVEFTLRDRGHGLMASLHQTGLDARKKRGARAPVAPAPPAPPPPSSRDT